MLDGPTAPGVATATTPFTGLPATHARLGHARSGQPLPTVWAARAATGRTKPTRTADTTTDASDAALDTTPIAGHRANAALEARSLVLTGHTATPAPLEHMGGLMVVARLATGTVVSTAPSGSGSTAGGHTTAATPMPAATPTTACTSMVAQLVSTRTRGASEAARAAPPEGTTPGLIVVPATAARAAGHHPATSRSA